MITVLLFLIMYTVKMISQVDTNELLRSDDKKFHLSAA